MAINFLQASCQTRTNERIFGIFDSPPATLVFTNSEDWHLWVDNDQAKEILHTAIDDCLGIAFVEGERCESMITYEDVLIFIELKDRNSSGWAGKARSQLINTIRLFRRDASISPYRRLYGHIANKQRPHFKSGGMKFSQEFEDQTGFILRICDVLKIN